MGNSPRHLSPECSLNEVLVSTFQGRFLFKPSEPFNRMLVGSLARAARRYSVDVVAPAFLSNHGHLLLRTGDQLAASRFMNLLNSKVAREVGRLYDWPGGVFHGPFKQREISNEEEAQVARLRYLLSQGVKEGLVDSPLDWPGVHCARALLEGRPLSGVWHDRTAEYNARRLRGEVDPEEFLVDEVLHLAPLPCWDHLCEAERRARVAELIEDIEAEARAERRASGRWALGAATVRSFHPHHRPQKLDKHPVQRFHAVQREVRRRMAEAYRLFLEAYTAASKALRSGERDVVFPPNCFPPALPFMPAEPTARPP